MCYNLNVILGCGAVISLKVSFEIPPVNRVHVVRLTLIIPRIHLSGWIYFQFTFDPLMLQSPFTDLKFHKNHAES